MAERYRVTIRGDGTEIRGYATLDALAELGGRTNEHFIVVASPVSADYDPFTVDGSVTERSSE